MRLIRVPASGPSRIVFHASVERGEAVPVSIASASCAPSSRIRPLTCLSGPDIGTRHQRMPSASASSSPGSGPRSPKGKVRPAWLVGVNPSSPIRVRWRFAAIANARATDARFSQAIGLAAMRRGTTSVTPSSTRVRAPEGAFAAPVST